MSVIVTHETRADDQAIVKAAEIENKNSRHFSEIQVLNGFPQMLQQKLAKVAGKFTVAQLMALLKQEVCDLRD